MEHQNPTNTYAETPPKKSYTALGIFLLQIPLFIFTYLSYSFRHGLDGTRQDNHTWVGSLIFIGVLIIYSLVLCIKHRKTRIYTIGDLVITLILPIIAFLIISL
jgi:uncharacterized membrane protein